MTENNVPTQFIYTIQFLKKKYKVPVDYSPTALSHAPTPCQPQLLSGPTVELGCEIFYARPLIATQRTLLPSPPKRCVPSAQRTK